MNDSWKNSGSFKILVLNAFCDKRKKHIDCTFQYIDSYSFAIDVDDVSSMKEQKTA